MVYAGYGFVLKISSLYLDQKASRINVGASPKAQHNKDILHAIFKTKARKTLHTSSPHYSEDLKTHITLLLYAYENLSQAQQHNLALQQLLQARSYLRSYLQRTPGSPNHWFLLTQVSYILGQAKTVDRKTLRLSYLTGPREAWIARRRLAFGFQNIQKLDAEFEGHLKKEFRSLGWFYKNDVLHLAQTAPAQFREHLQNPLNYNSPDLFKYIQKRYKQKKASQ